MLLVILLLVVSDLGYVTGKSHVHKANFWREQLEKELETISG